MLPSGHPFLNVPNQAYFWSTTDLYTDGDYAWSKILLGYNFISARSKDTAQPYFCVRGIGVVDR
jgi:hypothetical protein